MGVTRATYLYIIKTLNNSIHTKEVCIHARNDEVTDSTDEVLTDGSILPPVGGTPMCAIGM